MKILITGSSGRVGRAVHVRLSRQHIVTGFDLVPASTTDTVADLNSSAALKRALAGVDAVVHVAALHAPHVGHRADADFAKINVEGTQRLIDLCVDAGVRRLVFTSTTAVFGSRASTDDAADWVTEATEPRPRTIYHSTKLEAEALCAAAANTRQLDVTTLRMSRCFPEPAHVMAGFRLHRGIDARDVASAHECALATSRPGYRMCIVSGTTPFDPCDAVALRQDAPSVLQTRAPELVSAFHSRNWPLPREIDRVYSSAYAMRELCWRPRFDFGEVLNQLEAESPEVLPVRADWLVYE